jgi:regulator of ribonuclease activity A
MDYNTSTLCDVFADSVDVVEPMFVSFGGRASYGGEITTIKCFEDKGVILKTLEQPGLGKILLIDGGGSMRRACLGDMLAEKASVNGWSGLIIYGCIRDVDQIMQTDIGVQALGVHPMKTEKKGLAEIDVALTFAGVCFRPGDYCYADNNGIIVSSTALIPL